MSSNNGMPGPAQSRCNIPGNAIGTAFCQKNKNKTI